jgi:hypothetical protein
MKKAKLKIDYFTCSSDATIKDIFKKGDILTYDKKLKMYYRKETNSLSTYPEIFIEKNTDIFEIFEEPEPQEEVIEGFVINQINEIGCDYFVKQKTHQMQTPATLILNPKPKKEYVRWVMKEFIDNLKNGHPIYRVLATESDYEKYCHKIKITVEEE